MWRMSHSAGTSIHPHLSSIFPPVLALASQRGRDDPTAAAAWDVARKVTLAVGEDVSYLLVAQVRQSQQASHDIWTHCSSQVKSVPAARWRQPLPPSVCACLQLEKGLEDPSKRQASAETIRYYCSNSRHDFQEHVPGLLTVCISSPCAESEVDGTACCLHEQSVTEALCHW